jgi:tetratricopeptide (TPR) repeat protein
MNWFRRPLSALLKDVLARLLPRRKPTGDRAVVHALKALDQADTLAAVEALERALAEGLVTYDEAEVRTVLGKAYKDVGRYDDAIAMHKAALALRPQYHKAWNNLGIVYLDTGRMAEAVRCFKQSIRCNPEYAFAYASLGAAYLYQDRPEKALGILQQAVALNPGIAVAHSNLALAYAMLGRFKRAWAALRHGVSMGYEGWERVQRRIENLAALDTRIPDRRRPEDHQGMDLRPYDPQVMVMPATCPNCGAPVHAMRADRTGAMAGHCPYCGVDLIPKSG